MFFFLPFFLSFLLSTFSSVSMFSVLPSLDCYKKCCRLGRLNNMHFFLVVLGTGNSKMKVLVGSLSGEGLLPGQADATFFLCPSLVESELWGLFLFL